MRLFARKALFLGVVLGIAGLCNNAHAGVCGLGDDGAAVSGTGFAGYWRGTMGVMRLVGYNGNMLEGPSSASTYVKGTESGNTFQGRFAEDTGTFYTGTLTLTYTDGGRCLKGHMVYDDGEDGGDWIGYRMAGRPEPHYSDMYAIDERSDHLKQLLGGVLSWAQIDGPDRIDVAANPPASIPPTGRTGQPGFQPPFNPGGSAPPVTSGLANGFQPNFNVNGNTATGQTFQPPGGLAHAWTNPAVNPALANQLAAAGIGTGQTPVIPGLTVPGAGHTGTTGSGNSGSHGNHPQPTESSDPLGGMAGDWQITASNGKVGQAWDYSENDLFKDAILHVGASAVVPGLIGVTLDKKKGDSWAFVYPMNGYPAGNMSIRGIVQMMGQDGSMGSCGLNDLGDYQFFFNPAAGTMGGSFEVPSCGLKIELWGKKK